MKFVFLGFEIKSGDKVSIRPSHLIVTGITQLSGKTTTLEALISRSGKKAVVFKTKIGETGFSSGTIIPPYYREKSGWQFVMEVLEATLGERLKFQRPWIIKICENTTNLLEVKHRVDEKLLTAKGLENSVYTELQAFLKIVLPQFQYGVFSDSLSLSEGINIMDLERFSLEMQSMVIESVLDTVLTHHKEVIVVMPEAWKFLPQEKGNPCKRQAETFIRQGAVNGNFLWLDSQDIAGVDKAHLKQVSTWILGLQSEKNEVKHTLDQVPLPKAKRPKEDEIMTLPVGHFFVCSQEFVKKIYVQPIWCDEEIAKKVALGKAKIPTYLKQPPIFRPGEVGKSSVPEISEKISAEFVSKTELNQLRLDFFKKLDDLGQHISGLGHKILELQAEKKEVNIEELVPVLLQKMPLNLNSNNSFNEESVINKVLSRIPSSGKVYEVAPLEKLKKNFQEEAKQRILQQIEALNSDERKYLKYVESQSRGVTQKEMVTKCFGLAPGGSSSTKMSGLSKTLQGLEFIRKSAGGRLEPNLRDRLKDLMGNHGATDPEIEAVYNHIIFEMIRK